MTLNQNVLFPPIVPPVHDDVAFVTAFVWSISKSYTPPVPPAVLSIVPLVMYSTLTDNVFCKLIRPVYLSMVNFEMVLLPTRVPRSSFELLLFVLLKTTVSADPGKPLLRSQLAGLLQNPFAGPVQVKVAGVARSSSL